MLHLVGWCSPLRNGGRADHDKVEDARGADEERPLTYMQVGLALLLVAHE